MKLNIAVIFGGRSVEHEVSIISAAQCMQAIDKEKYQVVPVYITKHGVWYTGDKLLNIENFRDLEKLLTQCQPILVSQNAGEHIIYKAKPSLFAKKELVKIDVAFPMTHGTYGEDGTLQGLLEQMNIAYVGCDVLASALSMDKITAKILLRTLQIPVLDDFCFYTEEWIDNKDQVVTKIQAKFPYPLMVKPANLGSSVGVSAVNNSQELEDAVDLAVSMASRILIEPKITNLKEVNCAVLGDHEFAETSVCEELFNSGEFLSYQDKYCGSGKIAAKGQECCGSCDTTVKLEKQGMLSAKRQIPANISAELTAKIENLAKQAFNGLNCAGVVRIDFLIDQNTNQIYLCELNAIPGSLAFHLWVPRGKTFTELTNRLLEIALKRHREKNNLTVSYANNILHGFQLGNKCK